MANLRGVLGWIFCDCRRSDYDVSDNWM